MGEKNPPRLFIFIFQFLREFITATKLMLTLELMQQDAKCFQLPGSLRKSKNWPFDGEKGGPYASLLIFSLLSFAAEKGQHHFGFFRLGFVFFSPVF